MEEISFYTLSAEEAAGKLGGSVESGLTPQEAAARLEEYGRNALTGAKRQTKLMRFLAQFKSFMIYILIAAAVVSMILGEIADGVIILVIVLLNAVMGYVQESKAEESLAALKKMSAPQAKVIRGGDIEVVPSETLVVGDLVVLDTGDLVPADLRLIEAQSLKIQEAALTGESVPVEKSTKTLPANIPLGDRVNLAFSGSHVTYGRGRGLVTATGMNTEVGKIAAMIQEDPGTETPLKQKLEKLGKTLGLAALFACVVIFVAGILYGKELFEMFFTSVSLAVAAIPEGLPAISTIVLALGVSRMAKRRAIVRSLPSVETLGSATVICSDKTGTLTQNKMRVEQAYVLGALKPLKAFSLEDARFKALVEVAMLCNDAHREDDGDLLGDPTETALLDMGAAFSIDEKALIADNARVAEKPFDSDRKLMSVAAKHSGGYIVRVKGGLDELLAKCTRIMDDAGAEGRAITDADIAALREANVSMAARALRVLAYAQKLVPDLPETESLESDLTLIGLTGMIDPPREEAKDAVAKCLTAGITPVMITGDHKLTACAIAQELNILRGGEAITGAELSEMSDEELSARVADIQVYARVAPEHKVRIVDAWQKRGDVVAMTGDGVNDAPALKRADIGAAMGIVGTDVSKEAADVVLTDDNFATIVSAVEEGRRIFDNILKAIQFLISCNVGEIVALFIATMLNWAEPLLPIHILWVNLVTDSLPALALGVEAAVPGIMERKARKSASLFSRPLIWRIGYQGAMIGLLTLAAFLIGQSVNVETGRTMAFSTLAFSQLFHAFNVKNNARFSFASKPFGNRYLLGAFAASAALMLAVLLIPPLMDVFKVVALDGAHWLYILLLSFAPVLVVDVFKGLKINGGTL